MHWKPVLIIKYIVVFICEYCKMCICTKSHNKTYRILYKTNLLEYVCISIIAA